MTKKKSRLLRNTGNSRAEAQAWAEKTYNALKNYPFEDISPDLSLKINPRAKRMALRVDPKKRKVKLVLPVDANMSRAYEFALEHKYWIREKIAELPELIHFVDGAVLSILGEDTTIQITYDKALRSTEISLKNNVLSVSTNKEDPSKRIKRFLVNLAKEKLTALSNEKAAKINEKISGIDVKDTISRWGSCSHDNRLSYSWRLIFAPLHAFDYVVAHEVAHMRVMDHSPAFWEECQALSAEYSKGKSWMKRHSTKLIRYSG